MQLDDGWERRHIFVFLEQELSQLCRGCKNGDCYAHVDEYIDGTVSSNPDSSARLTLSSVRKCKCPDPHKRHGKLRHAKAS